jgi:membrane protein YdbS with pleckstrin-like domain
MKLSAPKRNTWRISLILGIVGVVSHFVAIPYVSPWSWWILVAGFALLILSTFIKNL